MSQLASTMLRGLTSKHQPYPIYKDSGVEWLGDVPTDWRVIKLGFLATKIGSGKTPSGGATVYVDEGITFLRSQNVYDDGLRLDDVVHITPDVDTEMAHSRVKPMDILINITGASIGRTCIVPLGIGSANVNQHVCIIRLNKRELIRFVSWAVKAQSTKAQIDNAQTGAAREGLNFEQIASLLLSLPPETECEQISDFLDYETARIDRLIAKLQRLLELLKEKRQAVISHAVTKGLNPNTPMKNSGIEWLGQVPEHWHLYRLKHLIVSMDQGWSPQCDARQAEEGEFGVMKVGCVNGGIFRSEEHKALPSEMAPKTEYRLKKQQLLVSRANTRDLVGSAAVVDTDYDNLLLCDKLYRIDLIAAVKPKFVALLLGTIAYRGQIELSASGASDSMQNIGQSTIKELPIALPPTAEIDAILIYIEARLATQARLDNQLKLQIQHLHERRTALISAAVTGKIDLRGWTQPAEEVAA